MKNNWRVVAVTLGFSACASPAATVQVFNGDPPGQGFNDPTPAQPVGGNPGTTIGLQRQIAFQFAANQWGQTLTSTQVIRVLAFITPLSCNATSAVLGAALPYFFFADEPGLKPGVWYPAALAEKLARADIGAAFPGDNFEILAFFNSQLGQPGCLPGGGFYYGLDTNTPAGQLNFVTVLLHELAHGLGFSSLPTDEATGARAVGLPSVWEEFLLDTTTNKTWLHMTDAERAASAINTNNLVWAGLGTTVSSYQVLDPRTELVVISPRSAFGIHEAQPAAFGPSLNVVGLTDNLVAPADTGGPSGTDGCEPFADERRVRGRIALVDRGTCTFTVKVKNAQNAGAVGVVVANNVTAGLPAMGGTDPTINIPSIGISQSLGNALRALPQVNPGDGGVLVTMHKNLIIRAGSTNGLVRLYTPNPVEPGSSVSHWDTSLSPSQLMEAFLNADLTHAVKPPADLTFSLLRDIGW